MPIVNSLKTTYYTPGTSPQVFYTAHQDELLLTIAANFLSRSYCENNTFQIGNVNLTSGYNFSTANKNFGIAAIGKSPTTLTLNANCASQAAVVTEINSKINTAGIGSDVQAFAANNGNIGIKVVSAWGTQLQLVSGAQDALSVMGLVAGTYNINMAAGYNFSTNSPTFYITINSGVPAVITLNQNQSTLSDVIAHINERLTGAFINEVEAYENNRGIGSAIGLRGKNLATAVNFTLAVGTNYDALQIFGWLPGTYNEQTAPLSTTFGIDHLLAANNTAYPLIPDDFYLELNTGYKGVYKVRLKDGDELRAYASLSNAICLNVDTGVI